MKNTTQIRGALIGKVHVLAKRLGYDEATYRTVLLTQTGKTSCRDMTEAQLSRLADALECLSKGKCPPEAVKLPQPSANGLGGQMLPTTKQWQALAALASRVGWSGLNDFRLLAFVHRTAKVRELGELSRSDMSKVISGLTRWLTQRKTVTKVEG